jgi:hypothetical protein
MAQHDYVIDNQSASAARTDINNVLQAIVSQNSGATAPSTTVANMIWYDTSTDLLKMRNEANSAFITLGTIDQTNNVFNPNFLPATQAEAEAGTNNVKGMTPLRVSQEITAMVGVANAAPVKTAVNASGSAPIYASRAWVNFNGTGTVAIRGSGNVTSITDNGVGDYTINFTTAMVDANYAAVGTSGTDGVGTAASHTKIFLIDRTSSNVRAILQNDDGSGSQDATAVSTAIFR